MIPSSTAADIPAEVLVVVFFKVKGAIVVQKSNTFSQCGMQNRQYHCGRAISVICAGRLWHQLIITQSAVDIARLSL